MSGGDAQAAGVIFPGQVIQAEGNHTHLYSELSYTTSSEVTMKADVLYSDYHSVSPFATNSTNNGIGGPFTIKNTNAFLPSPIAAQMALDGVTSFPLGRINSDFGGLNGTVTDTMDSHTYWASVSADGTFGRSWRWNLFYNHGATDTDVITGPMQLTDLLAASVDSVMSGGRAVCANTTLKNPITGASCVPVNLFGFGSPSPEALAFFSADSHGYWTIGQNEAGGQLQGDPFSSWAGPVSLAAGVEWRTNSLNLQGDALAKAGRFNRQNFPTIIGHNSVVEGFAETVVPLLKDMPAAQELDFNGAVRESHYSTSGSVTSWKFGATDRVTGEILLRGTYSQDIRAPTVSELFTVRTTNFGSVIDPERGNATVPVTIFRGGNTRLQPEKARSLTYGLVYTPEWLPSFNLSVDWYAIHMRNTVTAASPQKLVDYCFAGVAAACGNVVRDGGGNITSVNSNNINLDELSTSGLDVEATHHWELGDVWGGSGGTLDSHLLANYVHEMVGKDGTTTNESLGVLSNVGNAPSQLRWRATLTEIYDLNRFEGYMRFRYLSGGLYQNAVTLNENHVGGQYYVDLGAAYFLTDDKRFQVYGNVVNAFDRSPPKYASAVATFYDVFGATYNVGLRATF
jgi:outer membrane receptor protein involved in Fe transport